MNFRFQYVLPVLLVLAGCAGSSAQTYGSDDPATVPGAAAPQQVDAVSDALGARMNSMLGTPGYRSSVTR